MQLCRAFLRVDPRIAAVALLIAMAAPALAIDPPKGSLRSREFSRAELAVSSSHVAAGRRPGPVAQPRRMGALPWRVGVGRCRPRPRLHRSKERSGECHHRAVPAVAGRRCRQPRGPDGAGRPPGTHGRRRRRRGRRRGRATVRGGARRCPGDRRPPGGAATRDAGLRHAVAGQRAAGRGRHHRARRAAGPDHQPRQRGGLRHRGVGHGPPAAKGGHGRREGDGRRLRLCGRPFGPRHRAAGARPSRSWPRRRPARARTSRMPARLAAGTSIGWSTPRPSGVRPRRAAGRRSSMPAVEK